LSLYIHLSSFVFLLHPIHCAKFLARDKKFIPLWNTESFSSTAPDNRQALILIGATSPASGVLDRLFLDPKYIISFSFNTK